MLSSLLDQMFQNSSGATTPEHYEFYEAVCRLLPSVDNDKIMLQSGELSLVQINQFDKKDNEMHMSLRYYFRSVEGSLLTDFSFASVPDIKEAIVACCVPPHGSSFVSWGPDLEGGFHRKYHEHYIGVCKWHAVDTMVYAIDSNFVLVHNCDQHFTSNDLYAGSVLVNTKSSKSNFITALECSKSVIFGGHKWKNIWI